MTARQTGYTIRQATPVDTTLLAQHRAAMFRDMGTLALEAEAALVEASGIYFGDAIPRGEYLGWVAQTTDTPPVAIGGAGVQLRGILPRPGFDPNELELGPEALVLNMYVDPAWRRQGVAEALMKVLLRDLAGRQVRRVVLHASAAGRRLYEKLGFIPNNEMRLAAPSPPNP